MAEKIRKMRPKKQERDPAANSRKIAWLVAAVGLCALLVAGIVIATSGSGNKKGRDIQAQVGAATTPSGTTPSSAKVDIQQVEVPPISIFRARNPFEPLVNLDPVDTTPVTAPTGASGSRVVVVPQQLRVGQNPAPEVLSRAVTLDGIAKSGGNETINVRVGNNAFNNIAIGQTFGENYKLLNVDSDSSATILYGDERFTLFTGQSIYP